MDTICSNTFGRLRVKIVKKNEVKFFLKSSANILDYMVKRVE